MPKNKRLSANELFQLRTVMVMTYPQCFVGKDGIKKPLKVGIYKDLIGQAREQFPDLSLRHIKGFLRDYCSGPSYHSCMRRGAARVDLSGNFAGFVDADQEAHSKTCLRKIAEAKKAREAKKSKPAPVTVESLTARLQELERYDVEASMSNDMYASSGKMAKAQSEMQAIRDQIKELGNA